MSPRPAGLSRPNVTPGPQDGCVTVSPMPCKIALLPDGQHGTPVATPLERRHSRFVELPPGGLMVPPHCDSLDGPVVRAAQQGLDAATSPSCCRSLPSREKGRSSTCSLGIPGAPDQRRDWRPARVRRLARQTAFNADMNCICGHTDRDHVAGGRCRVPDCPCEHFQPGDTLSAIYTQKQRDSPERNDR